MYVWLSEKKKKKNWNCIVHVRVYVPVCVFEERNKNVWVNVKLG